MLKRTFFTKAGQFLSIALLFTACNTDSNDSQPDPIPDPDPDFGTAIEIPDRNFERALLAHGIDTDGELNHQIWEQDALAAIEMNLFFTGSDNEDKITDLTGIEAFKNVEHLIVGDHALQTVFLTENTALKKLYLSFNQITEIDLSKNISLTHLFIGRNDLATLDLSHNTELQYLHVEANQLTSLDVSHNPNLIEVLATANLLSTATGFENASQLTKLYLGFNDLKEFSIQQPSLEGLNIENNLLTELNVDNCSNLEYLLATGNKLTELNISTNEALKHLKVSYNNLQVIDMSNSKNLEKLWISGNNLSHLDVSELPLLHDLRIVRNALLSCIKIASDQVIPTLQIEDHQSLSTSDCN